MSDKILQISKILLKQKRGVEAIYYLYHGIKKNPKDISLYVCLGDVLRQALEYDLALKIYRRALNLADKQGNSIIKRELVAK
ncbi:MAG: hypothetical protein ACTSQQ_17390, partial [Candidatus Helarchaeota archaeon]